MRFPLKKMSYHKMKYLQRRVCQSGNRLTVSEKVERITDQSRFVPLFVYPFVFTFLLPDLPSQTTMTVDIIRILSSALLFCLVFGMSATVDVDSLKAQLKNKKAIRTGLLLQFVFLPLIGFVTVSLFNLDHATGVILLIVTSSPGGSYSNWWCSIFNADLALSVAMTAISTCLSAVLLPFNMLMYAQFAYGDDLIDTLDWGSLAITLSLVITAICSGLYASALNNSHAFNLNANRLGNYSGLILTVVSVVLSNSHKGVRLWHRNPSFYFGVAVPCVAALLIANAITLALKLPKTEVVTISIESCCQNVGIAMSVAMSMFYGDDLARAVAVPLYYGILQASLTFCYCMVAWKLGWTKAPAEAGFWTMIRTSYEILTIENEGGESHKEADGFFYVDHEDAPKPATVSDVISSSTGGSKLV
jgi:predicted Na+-dependent transporter